MDGSPQPVAEWEDLCLPSGWRKGSLDEAAGARGVGKSAIPREGGRRWETPPLAQTARGGIEEGLRLGKFESRG